MANFHPGEKPLISKAGKNAAHLTCQIGEVPLDDLSGIESQSKDEAGASKDTFDFNAAAQSS